MGNGIENEYFPSAEGVVSGLESYMVALVKGMTFFVSDGFVRAPRNETIVVTVASS